jgi:hypothetical protein
MTETTAVQGETLCGATAELCVCLEPAGHEMPHKCKEKGACGGQWNGEYDTDSFEVVVFPGGNSALDAMLLLMGGRRDEPAELDE